MDALTVRAIRLFFGLTQEEFAERLGMSLSAISAVETGKRAVTKNLRVRIAQKFDVDDERLIDAIRKSKTAEKYIF
jgi:antitoxin HigA-1